MTRYKSIFAEDFDIRQQLTRTNIIETASPAVQIMRSRINKTDLDQLSALVAFLPSAAR